MLEVRRAEERGRTRLDWLDSRHTFSFGDYYDPKHMGFRSLRVINEDRVAPGGRFGSHPHRDMEIVSYVLQGALEHSDNLGNHFTIRGGELQRMTAGTGIVHSEANASATESAHFLQIWLTPERSGLEPGYEQREFPPEERRGRLRLLACRDGHDGALTIHQDVEIFGALLDPDARVEHSFAHGRHSWVQLAWGTVVVNGELLTAGDGAAVNGHGRVSIVGVEPAELLLFDLG